MNELLTLLILMVAQGEKGPQKHSGLERLKKLTGEWSMEGVEGVAVHYRVTARGSAVLETLFPGTEHEMITLYTMDGDRIKLTHYCAVGNQPTMKEEKSEEKSIRWVCDGKVGGAKSHDEKHMHAVTITFVDEDHLRSECAGFADGTVQEVKTFEFTRKK